MSYDYFTTAFDDFVENGTGLLQLLTTPVGPNGSFAALAGPTAAGAGGGLAGAGAGAGGAAAAAAATAAAATSASPLQPVRRGPAATVRLVAPSWDAIRADLKWGFLLHVYGFACLFCVLAFYAFFSILNLRSLISARPFMSTINGFLCLLGASRAACLFIDPYNVKESMPKVIGSVLWDVGFPCVTSAFCLIQLAFLQLTQLNLGPEKLRRKSCLSLIITAHFTFVVAADLGLGFQDHFLVVKYAVQTLFLCWGLLLCGMFLYGGYRVMALLREMPGSLLGRDAPDRGHKGIMQLALLAPYHNLTSSVAAALAPTLLAPKIRITDENEQTVSFGSDSGPAAAHPDPDGPTARAELCAAPGPDPRGRACPGPGPAATPPGPERPPTPAIVVTPGSRRGSAASVCSQRDGDQSRRGSDVSRRSYSGGRDSDWCGGGGGGGGVSLVSPTASSFARQNSWPQPGPGPAAAAAAAAAPAAGAASAGASPRSSFRGPRAAAAAAAAAAEPSEDEVTAETSLLPQRTSGVSSRRGDKTPSSDLTLHSILNHIAYVNRSGPGGGPATLGAAAAAAAAAEGCSRKGQLQTVLHVTYATALLGVVLCLADMGRLYGPYGLAAATRTHFRTGEAGTEPARAVNGSLPRPWPWFCFQTLCRALEFAMGCAMANITKQPVNSRHHMLQQQYAYSLRAKPREALYI